MSQRSTPLSFWQVLEVRPSIEWDKGKAVEFLLKSLGENCYILMGYYVVFSFQANEYIYDDVIYFLSLLILFIYLFIVVVVFIQNNLIL